MGGQTVDTTATRVNGRTGQRNIFTGEPEPPKDETRQRQFKPDPKFVKPPKGFNPDQLEFDFNQQQQRQRQLPPSQEKPDINKLLDRTRKKKFSPSFIPTMEPRREPETQTQTDGGGNNKKPPKKPPTTGESGGSRAFNSILKFSKRNPAAALATYDLGKGILSKIMKTRMPSVSGGRAGFRSAGGNTAT